MRLDDFDSRFEALFEERKITHRIPQLEDVDKASIRMVSLAGEIAHKCGYEIYGQREHMKPEEQRHMMSGSLTIPDFFARLNFYFPNKSHILDLGCGSGFPVALGLALRYESYGVDTDPEILKLARENLKLLERDPNRVVEGNFLEDKFWETKIGDRTPGDFDAFYVFNYDQETKSALEMLC